MPVINKVTLHRGTKSVTVFVHGEDCRHLFTAAIAHDVSCRSVEYARHRTVPDAWSSFLQMRLALHEDRAAPSASHSPDPRRRQP